MRKRAKESSKDEAGRHAERESEAEAKEAMQEGRCSPSSFQAAVKGKRHEGSVMR